MQLDFTVIFMIIDEAHNVETNLSDGRSFHHTRNTLNCDLIYIKKQIKKTLNKKIPKKKVVLNIIFDILMKGKYKSFDIRREQMLITWSHGHMVTGTR